MGTHHAVRDTGTRHRYWRLSDPKRAKRLPYVRFTIDPAGLEPPARPARCTEHRALSNITGLFETWYPRLVRSVRARVGSADDAEDVAQEAFVRLLGEQPRDSRAWLFAVADRLAIDHRRASARRERFAARPAWARSDDIDTAPDDALLRDERVADVRRVLRILRTRDRQLLLLYHAGLSYREIASQLGVAPSSIGSLLTRAHRRFLARYTALHATPVETVDDA
jgi:RNA polymerase sigma-70 factor (ECF subfamily)